MPGVLYSLFKVHKAIVDLCPRSRPVLSAIDTATCKTAKFLVPILICLTFSKITGKESFLFAKEIVEQDSSFYLGSLDEDSLFTNIPLG